MYSNEGDIAYDEYRRRDGAWAFIKRVKNWLNIIIHWIIAFFFFSFLHYIQVNLMQLALESPFWKVVLISSGVTVILIIFFGRGALRV